ncbi:DUF6644 family protein [uncultured Sphingomonas sp.]|uniref:DUF6644 family protein n=1 Tax=uncultured Sphingomonas sp. TaxID=158754 RepID=UPI0035CB4532
MSIDSLAQRLSATPLAETLTDSNWLFGTLEAVHVLALSLVLGSIAFVDVQLIGLGLRDRPPRETIARMLPITWAGFALAATTGTLMIFANPIGYFTNTFFRIKLALLVAAGLNVLAFHFGAVRRLDQPRSLAPRISGALSLTIWLSVVVCGRWIGFTI